MAEVDKEITVKVKAQDDTQKATQSAKARLRDLQKQMLDLEAAGQKNTDQFRKMSAEAGSLKDAIGDTSAQVKVLASDTRTLDTFTSAIQGVAGGFAVAQGAAALFGEENEDVQKAMMKVQAALALVNGATALANTLNKDSALMVNLNAAAQRAYALAVGTSTGALKAFRIALVSTGVGAAAVAIGYLAANFDKLTAAVKNFLGMEVRDQEALDAVVTAEERRLQIMQARGDKEEKIHMQDMRLFDVKINAAEKEEDKAQLRHEKEVARLTYESKLRDDAAQKVLNQKAEEAALFKSTDSAALQSIKELELALANRYEDSIQRELELTKVKQNQLLIERDEKRKHIQKTIHGQELQNKALEKLDEDYYSRRHIMVQETDDKIIAIRKKTLEELQVAQMQTLQAVSDFIEALSSGVFKKNKALAYAALAFSKGVAIADVLVNLAKEKSAISANIPNTVASPDFGVTAKTAMIKLANIRAGLSIAKILATGIGQAKSIAGGGDSGGGGNGGLNVPSGMAAPQGNALNPNSQLLNPNTGQAVNPQPLRAYVVESDVSGIQNRLRTIRQFAQLGN